MFSYNAHRGQRGAALATTLALLFMLSTIALGLMSLVAGALRMAQRRSDTTEAFNMADSGIDLGILWLTNYTTQHGPPHDSDLSNWSTQFFGTSGTLANPYNSAPGSALTVRIDGDAGNFSGAGKSQKCYLIESQAQTASGATQIVRAYVRQTSFGKYAFFADVDSGGFWDYNNHFEGPFHSNDQDPGTNTPSILDGSTEILWKNNQAADPMFLWQGDDAFSVSGNVTWWKDSIGSTVAPTANDGGINDFLSLAKGGLPTMTYGYQTDAQGRQVPNSPQIPLPSTDYLQQYVALGHTPPNPCNTPDPNAPITSGVTVSGSGGIYIHGNSTMQLNVDPNSGNQVIVVGYTSGASKFQQTVTINPTSTPPQTQVATQLWNSNLNKGAGGWNAPSTQTISGAQNGMLYSDGNITSLQGTIADNKVDSSGNITSRSQLTIATDFSHDITLTGSLKYNTSRNLTVPQSQDTNFNQKAGTLGLLTRNANVASTAGSNIEFDASIFATGTFQYPGWGSGGSKGTMTSIGGVIVHQAGVFASADSSGNILNGYSEQYHYDSRLADYPPPFFPTTGHSYDLLSWQRVGSTL